MVSLEGRSIVVVGGGSGIGWATATLALELGARVTIMDIDPAAAQLVTALGGAAQFIVCDACNPGQIDAALRQVADRCSRIDGFVTTVGGAHLAPLRSLDLAGWEQELRFNLSSVYVGCRAALPYLERNAGASIVTISSGYAIMAGTDRMAYSAAKAGVIAFTRSLAAAAAPSGVRANCIAPGPVDTPRFRAMNGGDAGVEQLRQRMPLGTIPQPSDCAKLTAFLLSNAASQITGQVIHINGGLLMP
jgi:meso-butanediol dehydrogenase / (S,S)-butanediol dehydrogenase / diacetyl reductase